MKKIKNQKNLKNQFIVILVYKNNHAKNLKKEYNNFSLEINKKTFINLL